MQFNYWAGAMRRRVQIRLSLKGDESEPGAGQTRLASYLDGLKWKRTVKFGWWYPLYAEDGTLRPELTQTEELIRSLGENRKRVVGSYEYRLGGQLGEFLFREPILKGKTPPITGVASPHTTEGSPEAHPHSAPPLRPEQQLSTPVAPSPAIFEEMMNLELAFWANEVALAKRYDRSLLKTLFKKRGVGYQYRGPNLRFTKYVKEAGIRDYYDMLGLTQRATQAGVGAGFAASKKDQNANAAYAILSDPEKRAEYDKGLADVKELFLKQVKLPSFRMLALGGAREIGRSSYYVRVGEGHYVLLDAGVKVENTSRVQKPRFDVLKLLPPVEAVIISHPHADHITGLAEAQRTAPEALGGVPIYMTEMTKKYFEEDKEALVRRGGASKEEVDQVFSAISTAPYGTPTKLDGLTFEFRNAGHVPGSAMVLLKAEGDTVLYTGDLNFERTEFEVPAKPVKEHIATLIMEATYAGETKREERPASVRRFVDRVTATIVAEKKVLVPAFTIGRCAEVVKILDDAIERGDIPPVKAYTLGLGAKFMQKISYKPKHFEMLGVQQEANETGEAEEEAGEERPAGLSQRLANMNQIIRHLRTLQASRGSHIVVAGSGFGDQGVSGRMISSAWDKEDSLVLFSGYVPAESVGGIMLKAKETGVMEPMAGSPTPPTMFRCEVDKIGLSAHASEEKLIAFIDDENPDLLILIHTKADEGEKLAEDLERRTMVPANLQVCFDWGQRGFRLMPYNSELAAVALRCSCSPPMAFTDLATAIRHTEMEGCHLVRDSAWYYFGFTGRCPAKFSDVKRSFLATAPASVKVAHVTLHGIVVEGTLTEEDIRLIQTNGIKSASWSATEGNVNQSQTDGVKSTSWSVGLKYNRKEELPIVSIKFPIAIAQIKDAIVALLGKDFILPDWRVERLPPDTGGYYEPSKDKLVVNANATDEEDTFSVIAHELTHCAQYKLNDGLRPKSELAQQERKAQDLFMEGFAQYVVVKLGHSKKLLTEIHEKVTPAMYYNGRKMFEVIEAAYGVQRTIEVGLTASPRTFLEVHAGAWRVGEEANPELVAPVKEQMKKAGVWRSGIFGSGFSSEFRREIEEYGAAHWRTVLEEFEGWAPHVVLDDVALLLIADLLASKYGVQTGRDNLRKALAFIIQSEQPEALAELKNALLRSAQAADEKSYLPQSEDEKTAPTTVGGPAQLNSAGG